jgi:hypothetical protein
MKSKFFRILMISTVVCIGTAIMVSNTMARGTMNPASQTNLATPTVQAGIISAYPTQIVSFSQLGLNDTVLFGPYDSRTISFGLPTYWQVVDGAEIELLISSHFVGDFSDHLFYEGRVLGANLDVYYNDKLVKTLLLQEGINQIYRVRIPIQALNPTRGDGRHTLFLFLNAGIDCDYDFHKTTVMIDSQSKFILPYTDSSITLDLNLLPLPIYQRNSIVASSAVIVVPKSPSADEMRAALIVSAAFGRMALGNLPVSLITTDQLNADITNTNHIIFVGKPEAFSLMKPFPLPAPIVESSFSAPGVKQDDGILQLIVSPWSNSHVILVVGGNSDAGVVKAAQALSSGAIKALSPSSLVIIADISLYTSLSLQGTDLETPIERAFTDLGYGIETATDIGVDDFSYRFSVSPGLIPKENPYIDLKFSNSALLDYTLSGLVVYVNDIPVGSVYLNYETTTLSTSRVIIPAGLIHAGSNEILVEVTLAPTTLCASATAGNLWLNIYPESMLHLALMPAPTTSSGFDDLSFYPNPYLGYPTLNNLAFIIPQQDIKAWQVASKIAYQLGSRGLGAIYNFSTAFDGEISEDLGQNRDIILIGLPNELSILTSLKDSLPIQFEEGNNVSVIQSYDIAYRIPNDLNLGYLELLNSPLGKGHSILAILGNSPDGLGYAGNTLSGSELRRQLRGNFAVMDDKVIMVADTRTGVGLSGITSTFGTPATPEVISALGTQKSVVQPPKSQTILTSTTWIPGAVIILVLIIIAVVIFLWRVKRFKQ